MNILLIDGQGGKLGKQLAALITERFSEANLTAIGTNCTATAAMLKGGAKNAATGENAVVVCSRNTDIIIGPIGIIIADSMLGEITPKMATAVAQSNAVRILLPANRCNTFVAGLGDITVNDMLENAMRLIQKAVDEHFAN